MANERFKVYRFDVVVAPSRTANVNELTKIGQIDITVPVVTKSTCPIVISESEEITSPTRVTIGSLSQPTYSDFIYNDDGNRLNYWMPFGYLTFLSGYYTGNNEDYIKTLSIGKTVIPNWKEFYTESRNNIYLGIKTPDSDAWLSFPSSIAVGNEDVGYVNYANDLVYFVINETVFSSPFYVAIGDSSPITNQRAMRSNVNIWSLIEFDDGTFGASNFYCNGRYYGISQPMTAGINKSNAAGSPEFIAFMNNALVVDSTDPFSPGGTSEPGGGGGTFDDDSDEIPDSSLPTLSAANTGFTRIYNPTLSQVQAMANYLWTDDDLLQTIWNHIKQFIENPMDAFIAFNLVPCAVPDGGTSNFKVMYIDTGVSMTVAANQFVDVDCGTVQLDRYYGSALDYTPYTRVGCFLPYIGTVELDTDEVMGTTLHVTYRIDIVSGACVAKIAVDGNILYQYSGHCAINIPFTAADFSNYVNAIIQVGKAALIAASGVPIGAAAAAEPAMQLTGQTIAETTVTQRNPATGRQITMGTERTERNYYQMEGTQASFKGLSPTNLANTVGAVMGSKPMIEHSGGFNGNSGYLGVRRPYIVIKRPRMCNPVGYGNLNGYPCMINEKLGNLSGYTQVQQVQLTGLSATNPEQAEILTLLKQGVIL